MRAEQEIGPASDAASHPAVVAGRAREWVRAMSRWLIARRLPLATGLAAAMPVTVSTAEVVANGWVPFSDDAVIAVRSFDVFTGQSPLVGQWSSGYSAIAEEPTYSLGPLLFWLLAVPARLPWPGSFEIAVGLVNLASVVGAVGLAHRRGGRPLMFAVAIAVPLMCASLPAEAYSDIWNPSAPLLPFTLLIFLGWSLACGEYRLLPIAVLVASFVAQSHFGYVIPAFGALLVGLGGLVISRRSSRTGEGRAMRPWIAAGVAVGFISFLFPLVDQVLHRPGNLVLIFRAATADVPSAGLDVGWRALVHSVGIPPWWLGDPQVASARLADLAVPPSAVATGSAVLALVALAATTLMGRARGRLNVFSAGALGLMVCACLVLSTALTPEASLGTVGYALRWASPAGMWVWVALGWSVAVLLRSVRALPPVRVPTLVTVGGVGTVVVVGGLVAAGGELRPEPYDEMRAISERVNAELGPDRAVRVDASRTGEGSFLAWSFQAGLAYSLRREGRAVTVSVGSELFGSDSEASPGGSPPTVRVDVDRPAPKRGRTVLRLAAQEFPEPGDPFSKTPSTRDVTVTLVPANRGQ
jgi:hypothetical protein